MKIVTSEEMRRIEQACAGIGLPPEVLMEKAGKAIAEETGRILGDVNRQHVLCLVGPGNNGGDGLVAAGYLHDRGAEVSVFLAGRRPADDPNLRLVEERGITVIDAAQDETLAEFDELLASAGCVIDALFGTGKIRPLRGIFQQVLEKTLRAKEARGGMRIMAVDLPSGVDADSGAADPASLSVDNTISLG
jgi:NAD(P)H-hydrate epimerase